MKPAFVTKQEFDCAPDDIFVLDYQAVGQPAVGPKPVGDTGGKIRVDGLDMARGLAVSLMVVSHTVKGLLSYSQISDWGRTIHLMTKFSSSLFILVFGIGLSLFFVPSVGTARWAKKRDSLWVRAFLLMLIYKVLTVVQMFQTYSHQYIVDTLLFKRFPDFVEVLCFYSVALLWIPFMLPIWGRVHNFVKPVLIIGIAWLGVWLEINVDWSGLTSIKAILVEHPGYFTFGQFPRGALIFTGLLIGDFLRGGNDRGRRQTIMALVCLSLALILLGALRAFTGDNFYSVLAAIGRNWGKHPPNLEFTFFSLGGALGLLGFCLILPNGLVKLFFPLRAIGKTALSAFVIHIVVIFIFYRWVFGLRGQVSYPQALSLACFLVIMLAIISWTRERWKGGH